MTTSRPDPLAADADLHVLAIGQGEPILFLHGTGGDAQSWGPRTPLADRYRLLFVDRRGYGASPDRTPSYGFDEEAAELSALITAPLHLVGQSYGAVLALLIAARIPHHIRSLTVSEPPAFSLAPDDPDVAWLVASLTSIYADALTITPEAFNFRFMSALGMPAFAIHANERPARALEATRLEHAPWLAHPDLPALAATAFPKLVLSGGWDGETDSIPDRAGRAATAICDMLERALPAQRSVIRGAGHALTLVAQPYNDRLATFLAAAHEA